MVVYLFEVNTVIYLISGVITQEITQLFQRTATGSLSVIEHRMTLSASQALRGALCDA